jgi:hypothetical protein
MAHSLLLEVYNLDGGRQITISLLAICNDQPDDKFLWVQKT